MYTLVTARRLEGLRGRRTGEGGGNTIGMIVF